MSQRAMWRALPNSGREEQTFFSTSLFVAILSQVFYAFALYLGAVVNSPGQFIGLLLFKSETTNAALSWLSIIVTLSLPVFLFYALRSVIEAIFPAWRVRRLTKNSDIIGQTTYTIDDHGVRSITKGGTEVFLPWTALDGCDRIPKLQ